MRVPRVVVVPCMLASLATGQQYLQYSVSGDSSGDALGSSAVSVDDLDGDGLRDLAVGSPGDAIRQVRLFSGATGQFLFALKGQQPGDGYGSSVAAVGDLDGDGKTELAVAAPGGGYVELVSLPTQARLWTWSGTVAQVSRAGDVDADGTLDVLALSNLGVSKLVAISGASGASGLTLTPPGAWRFLDGGGDANGDGHADILLGNPFWPNGNWDGGFAIWPGRVQLYSGANGALLHEKIGGFGSEYMGWGVCWLDDLDGDAKSEFAAGAPGDILLGDPGQVFFWSGGSGAFYDLLPNTSASGGLGTGIRDAGDLDGDGLRDLLVSSSKYRFEAYSSATGFELAQIDLSVPALDFPEPLFGALDDLDGDGNVELFSAHAKGTSEGVLQVWKTCKLPSAYCIASPNSAHASGTVVFTSGSVSVSTNNFQLHAAFLVPNSIGLFLYSAGQSQIPFGNGYLCVGGGTGVFRILPPLVAPSTGALVSQKVDFTKPPFDSGPGQIAPGSVWNFQYWYRDVAAPPAFFNLSNGQSVTFCP